MFKRKVTRKFAVWMSIHLILLACMNSQGQGFENDRENMERRDSIVQKDLSEQSRREKEEFDFQTHWINKIRFSYPDSECLAYIRASGTCVATVADFNENLTYGNCNRWWDSTHQTSFEKIKSVRSLILGISLESHYLNFIAANLPIQEQIEAAWKSKLMNERSNIGKQILQNVYKNNFAEYFSAWNEKTIQLIGSSDSSFIDSIARTSLVNEPEPSSTKSNSEMEMVYRWNAFDLFDLPKDLAEPIDNLDLGRTSSPIKLPYGWFLGEVTQIKTHPAITYEQAIPWLITLTIFAENSPENFDRNSAILSKPAVPQNSIPLEIKTWLCPQTWVNGKSLPAYRTLDTTQLSSISITISDLPSSLQKDFSKLLSQMPSGFLKNKYGVWYIQQDTSQMTRFKKPVETASPSGWFQAKCPFVVTIYISLIHCA